MTQGILENAFKLLYEDIPEGGTRTDRFWTTTPITYGFYDTAGELPSVYLALPIPYPSPSSGNPTQARPAPAPEAAREIAGPSPTRNGTPTASAAGGGGSGGAPTARVDRAGCHTPVTSGGQFAGHEGLGSRFGTGCSGRLGADRGLLQTA